MTPAERERYSRQIALRVIGEEGQQRLRQATVAIVGCGALGSLQASALARAGVGRLLLVDRDCLELSNLQRQWLYNEEDLESALPKAVAAGRRLARINSGIEVHPIVADLTPSNIEALLGPADLILDGTDNFETRYLINDYAVREEKPWIYGAALGTYGITMPVVPAHTACLKCLYPDPPAGSQPTCETEGVLNAVTAAVAAVQSADAIRMLCEGPSAVRPRITVFELWEGRIRQVEQPGPQPDCPACARREFAHLAAAERPPVVHCGRDAVQIYGRGPLELDALARRLAPLGEVRASEFALRFRTGPYELIVFPDGRTLVKGVSDPGMARSLHARYIGN